MEDIKKIVIPDGVVDVKAYKQYYALSNHPIFGQSRFVETSDGGEVNLGAMTGNFRRYIAHLSPKEQEELMEMKTKFNQLLMKKNRLKAKAFGNIGWSKKKKKDEPNYTPYEADIVELLGRMFTIAEVVKIMGEDNEVIINEDDVKRVLKKHINEVERKREEFRNKVADVRLYNKRPRLEELAWMYSKMKMRYVSGNSTDSYNAMLRTLEQIRKESEGDVVNINGAIDMNVNVEINAHIQKEILKTINLREIILGRIAARMQYDPMKLIAGLHNSYYAKFVQISGDFDPDEEMQFPSLINYDYNEIERRNAQVDDIVDIEAEEITEQEKQKAQSVKDLFLSKIRKQREEAEAKTSAYINEADSKRKPATDDYEEIDRYKLRKGNIAAANDKKRPSKGKGTGKKL